MIVMIESLELEAGDYKASVRASFLHTPDN